MAASKDAAKVPAKEYLTPAQVEADRAADKSNYGTVAGKFADKTYYVDTDGKVSTSPPERGSILVAEGDVVTDAVAEQIKGVK